MIGTPPARDLAQRGEHARVIGAGIMADAEQGVAMLEILERHGALAHADRLGQADAGRLVAHVRAVGEIVGAIDARQQLVEERRFVGGAAGSVEFHPVGTVEAAHRVADALEGFVPADRHEPVRLRVIAQRVGQPAGIFQVMVVPAVQLGHRVLREESGVDALDRRFPGHGLGAVLAEFEGAGVLGVGPGAAGAVEAVGLVHLQQRARIAVGAHLVAHRKRRDLQRVPAGGRTVIGFHAPG